MESLTSILQCPICYTQFNSVDHIPKVLTCGHSICSNSLEKVFSDGQIKCPQCRQFNQYESISKVSTNFSFIEMLRTLSDKNFLMIGSQPIQDEMSRLKLLITKVQEENYEIEYYFDQKIEELKKEKESVMQFNQEKIRALQAYHVIWEKHLNPVQVSVNLDDLTNNQIINDKKNEVLDVKEKIVKLSTTYLVLDDIKKGLQLNYGYQKLMIQKDLDFDALDDSNLMRDYLKLFKNILRQIDIYSTIKRNYLITKKPYIDKITEILQRKSELNIPEAQVVYGFLLKLGLVVPKDAPKANECFRKAAQQGDARGCYLTYLDSNDLKYLYMAVRKDYHNAYSLLGIDIETQKYDDDELRFIFFLAAANKGSPAGKSNIASFLCKEKQYDKAAFWYQAAIEAGYLQRSRKKLDKIYKKTKMFRKKFPDHKKWKGDYQEYENPKTILL